MLHIAWEETSLIYSYNILVRFTSNPNNDNKITLVEIILVKTNYFIQVRSFINYSHTMGNLSKNYSKIFFWE